jgi:glycine cleavage system aminomethyltransferase T/glycine/D-amino acid oxidase-like deaminating enzyme
MKRCRLSSRSEKKRSNLSFNAEIRERKRGSLFFPFAKSIRSIIIYSPWRFFMSDIPQNAQIVVIGAGIVGNGLVYHLAELGWTDILMIDKGPLPNPGGSTGHASNFIFPVDHSKEMTHVTFDSVKQYKEMGVFTQSGGIEVARTEARMEELRRRMASAKSWGIDAQLLTPKEVVDLVPYVDPGVIRGGFYVPSVGVVDSLRAGTIMRERAAAKGALQISPNTEVLGMDVVDGRVTGVNTNRGHVNAEYVLIAAGCWSPKLAAMAGATIPLTPAVHQMISVGPLQLFEKTSSEIEYPIIRDMDTFCYERQNGNDMEVGSYAHRPILMDAREIPSLAESALSPTELPFTEEDFEPQLEQALELMPEILGDEKAGIRYAINGLLSLTPDGGPLIGETVEVRNLWSVAAIWIKEGPGFSRAAAEWFSRGYSEIDIHASDLARFYPYARTKKHIRARTSEAYNKTYGIVHPREQYASNRNVRVSPFYIREHELGAVFFETAGWERPQWYASNEPLLEKYKDQIQDRPHEWDARWWSPIISAEHLAMRDRVAMVDLTAFALFDVEGPGVVEYIEKMCVNKMDVKVGRGVYTPVLAPNGGFKSDLTILRLAKEKYRIITGGGDGGRDKKWFSDNLPDDRSVILTDMTSALCTLGLWGPHVRDVLQSVTDNEISNEAFPYGTCQELIVNGLPVTAFRISYVGELGWELYTSMEHGMKLWDTIWEAGQPYGIIPAGIGVYGTTGRLEKGYRLMGHELESEYNPIEAGLARPLVKRAHFIGKEAYLKARAAEPIAHLCTLTVEDHTSASGMKRFMMGGEPITTTDGRRIADSHGRPSYVTSAGAGPSVGKHLLMAYLPVEHAVEGKELAVEYMHERYPVKVAVVGSRPLFDPDNERMKA